MTTHTRGCDIEHVDTVPERVQYGDMTRRNTYFISPATGLGYWIDATTGLATLDTDEGQGDHGCECEIDWNCSLHAGSFTALERRNDHFASIQTEIDARYGV